MKTLELAVIFALLFSLSYFNQDSGNSELLESTLKGGLGAGSVLAIVLSWERNKSILLAILHGLFSWLYVLYFAVTRKSNEGKF